MDIEVMNIANIMGEVRVKKNSEKPKIITATKFVCIPGDKPVIVPMMTPIMSAIINSNNI
jgi:carbamate kinase